MKGAIPTAQNDGLNTARLFQKRPTLIAPYSKANWSPPTKPIRFTLFMREALAHMHPPFTNLFST
jgi:hypothetical protein